MKICDLLKKNLPGYEIISLMEFGGSSEVYKIVNKHNGELFVLKVVTHQRVVAKEASNEIKALETLGLLVKSFEIDIVNENETLKAVCILMKLYPGIRLDLYLAEHKSYDRLERLELALKCAQLVQNIHEKSLLHNDISPSNFIYDSLTNNLNIIDFGWSRQVDGDFSKGLEIHYWGWRWFNPPEYLHYKGIPGGILTIKPNSEIYMLGHTLKYLLGQADPSRFKEQPDRLEFKELEDLIEQMTIESSPEKRINIHEVVTKLNTLMASVQQANNPPPARCLI